MPVTSYTEDEYRGSRRLAKNVNSGKGSIPLIARASATGTVPANTNQTNQIATGKGILTTVLITTAAAAVVTIYDGTSASGTVIGYIASAAAVGTIYQFDMPFENGIFIQGAATFPGLTVAYTET